MIPDEHKIHLSLLAELATQENSECYLVGGYLRDLFLCRENKDLDFACSKNPKKMAQKFASLTHSSFFVLHEEEEIFRVTSKDGAQFDFGKFKGKTIEEDLSLRDFTINAMAVAIGKLGTVPEGTVPNFFPNFPDSVPGAAHILDPYDGKKDLERRCVRQISPKIYEDDPLRLLRAFRIAAQLQFEIELETFETIRKNSALIKNVSRERVREEILLTLENPHAYPTILKMDSAGLLSPIFPEIDPNRNCALDYYPGKGVWGHSLDALKYLEWIFENLGSEFPQDYANLKELLFSRGAQSTQHSRGSLMKLAALLHDIGKAPTAQMVEGRLRFFEHQNVGSKLTKKAAERLRFSAEETRSLSTMVFEHMRPGGLAFAPNLTDRARFRFFRDLGENALPTLIVSLADRYTYVPESEHGKGKDIHENLVKDFIRWHYKKEEEESHKKKPLIDGNILMQNLNIPPGPTVGFLLKEIEEAAAVGEIRTPEEALTLARALLEKCRDPKS